MMMASILGSQGVVFATAMAVSGTVILLALRLQKSLPAASADLQFPPVIGQIIDPQRALRSCISSDGKRRSEKKKKTKKSNKRVHFAKDVVDPIGYSEEFRRKHTSNPIPTSNNSSSSTTSLSASDSSPNLKKKIDRPGMPANRMALYNGILRDRVVHRLACSY